MTAQVVKVVLSDKGTSPNTLTFELPSGSKSINLDDEENEQQIKDLFAQMLEDSLESELSLRAVIPEDREHDLYGEVSSAYIKALDGELKRIDIKLAEFRMDKSQA